MPTSDVTSGVNLPVNDPITVDERIIVKRPDITPDDVRHAYWTSEITRLRDGTEPLQSVGIGFDRNGRMLEWVAAAKPVFGEWHIYHCMPATSKVKRELGILRSR